ncbi:rifin [Plasmodium sp. gorilla clade G1]|nr:rifin [Plasmodium sp. gorilla clade G1]
MTVHYINILFFAHPSNILVHCKNKPYNIPHTPTTTSRVLSERDIYTSIYDNDEDMKSVKDNFDRQTSQRFEEYEQRMITNRKKYKEQCEKDIQQIILKDKKKKSLEEKVEKGCLKCGCGLGGLAVSVGLFGGLGIYGWKTAATAAAMEAAKQAGIEKGIQVGVPLTIQKIKEITGISVIITEDNLANVVTASYGKPHYIVEAINDARNTWCASKTLLSSEGSACASDLLEISNLSKQVGMAAIGAHTFGNTTAAAETKSLETTALTNIQNTSTTCTTAIIASTVVILVIVLIMLIIYFLLRYRRKNKMNKKLQYTNLLKE